MAEMYAAQLFNSAEARELPGCVRGGDNRQLVEVSPAGRADCDHRPWGVFIDNIRTIMAILLAMTGPYSKQIEYG